MRIRSKRFCLKCCSVGYCSGEHEVLDREKHTRECPVLESGIDNQVGFPLAVKAALFPTEGGEPRIVDVPYKLVKWVPSYPQHELDLTAFFGRVRPSRTRIEIAGFRRGPRLGHRLSLFFNDNFIADRSPPNECVRAIHGGSGFSWCDNLLAVRHVDMEKRIIQFQDVTPEDVEVVRKYFEEGGNGAPALEAEELEAVANGLRELAPHFHFMRVSE